MGKNLGDVEGDNEEEAMAAIAGYAVGIDMTARNVQEVAKKNRLPWSEAKGFDTFLPLR
jgi:acylpyruvate hydrolase